ncbi:MAG TPA: AAA family ATPase [Candidatus Acidoferrales bacterium]
MRIHTFRIRKYRNVEDSGEIELLDNLTCIVGKNHSGKTALLRALHKFNPHEPSPYDMRREWPRGQRTKQNTKQIVAEVQFILEASERSDLGSLIERPLSTNRVRVAKDYAGTFEILFPDQPDLFPDRLHPNDFDEAFSDLNAPTSKVSPAFIIAAQDCLLEVRRLASEGRFTELAELPQAHRERLEAARSPASSEAPYARENAFVSAYTQKLVEVQTRIMEALSAHQKAHDYVVSRIPTFIYMSDYKSFRGRAELEAAKQKRDNKAQQLSEEDETFLMILELAGINLDELISQGKSNDGDVLHDRQLDLQDAATTLTRNVAGRWGQNNYEIQFRTDGQTFFTDIEEVEKRIGMIPLEEQSKGFQWFFSFDLHFMHDSEGTFEGCVLLLDEPGLHLHPGGQEDLLKRLDAYAEKNMTIYSTHLPFLVDLREPARIKVINQGSEGAYVTDNLGESQPQEKLTLQAALGMRANQSYLVAQQNLVVEGVDDYWLISELSNVLERAGEDGLPEGVMVSAAGGASEVVHLATFIVGQELEVVALFDSDEAGRREEIKLRTKWLTRYKTGRSSTLLLGTAVGSSAVDFTIEDLFPADYYLQKVRTAHNGKLKALGKSGADLVLMGDGPILPRVDQACQQLGVSFNKGSVAKLIRKELVNSSRVDQLPTGTADFARRLISAIRESFDS